MKNFTFLAIIVCLMLCAGPAVAQKTVDAPQKIEERCGTMRLLAAWEAQNPDIVANSRLIADRVAKNPSAANTSNRLNAIVTIPIVFHIVLPNPFIITDADVQAQVDRLNLDYSGLNPDSANIPAAFQAVRGHSQLRFVLAKRTPGGALTNGIERRASSTVYTASQTADPIKSTTQGGLDVWDANQYFNIWVGTGGGLLGYATFPGTSAASQQGVVTDIIGTAANPCYVDPNYNLGRTLTHEAGHYFGLYHIWGDETGCTNSDFRNLSGTCPITDATLAGSTTDQNIGDTPNQGDENYGCPSGTVTNSCGNTAGDMYQNYMDYTNDACMTMFTAKQAARMEWIVQNCRTGYLSSTGAVPPTTAVLWDAAPQATVNPGGSEQVGCTTVAYTNTFSCATNISPRFRIENRGVNTITSLTAGYRYDNGTAVSQTFSVNLPSGSTTVLSFAAVSVSPGNHTFKFFTSSPNGNADQVPANDTLTQAFRVLTPSAPPVTEAFETAPPFVNFVIDNPNGDGTWVRTTPGRAGSAGKLSIDNESVNNRGTVDDLRSTSITVDPTRSYVMTFDVAHRYYNQLVGGTTAYDTLSVDVSTNCGQSYTRVYQKFGPTLATAGGGTAAYTTPAATEWRTETILLSGAQVASGQIVVRLRNSGRYGNWIHIDNVNISLLQGGDLQLVSINAPGQLLCSNAVTPSVTVRNVGVQTITGFKVSYSINGGATQTQTVTGINLLQNASQDVTLPATTITGTGGFNILAYTSDPVTANGTGDINRANDTLRKTFYVPGTTTAPLAETFVATTFPPTGWSLINPDANLTWARSPIGLGNAGSAFYNTYNYTRLGQKDDLVTPIISYPGADSVTLAFNLAASTYSYPGSTAIPLDTLEVLVTRDCGATYTTVYKKWGAELQTVRDPNSPQAVEFVPNSPSQWRRETINISQFAQQSPLLVVFRGSNNFENNIYIDNVDLFTTTLPTLLKQQGYLVYPTAFRESFMVRYFQDPTSLRYINIINSAGQLVWSKKFNNSMDRQIMVDLTGRAAGVYFVELGYQDPNRNITQRVTKF